MTIGLKQRILVAALILVGTLLCVEVLSRFYVARVRPEQSPSQSYDRKFYLATTPPKDGQSSLFIMGDSLANMGIYPELLELRLRESGLAINVKNLASSLSSPAMAALLLKKAIASGIKPIAVIYDINPSFYDDYYLKEKVPVPDPLLKKSYIGRCKLAGIASHPSQKEKILCLAEQYSYFLRYRGYFKEEFHLLDRTLFSTEKILNQKPPKKISEEMSPAGWSPGYRISDATRYFSEFVSKDENLESMATPSTASFPWHDASLRDFQAVCQTNHILLILLLPPIHPIQNNYYKTHGLRSIEYHYLPKIQALSQQPFSMLVDLHLSDSRIDHYFDSTHMNVIGAMTLTDNLAESLSKPATLRQLQGLIKASQQQAEDRVR